MTSRLSTGLPQLDNMLGGGLLPGTLTVVVGATGIGKTQLGLQFAQAGQTQEGETGILLDLTTRGDSQNHGPYAERMCGWSPSVSTYDEHVELDDFYAASRFHGEYLHVFDYVGQRVTKRDLEFEQWRDWQARQ